MSDKKKPADPIPEEFATLEEAAEFWDTHDTTSYPDVFVTIEAQTELRERHYEVEVAEDVILILREHAQKRRVSVSDLVNDLLRQQILPAT